MSLPRAPPSLADKMRGSAGRQQQGAVPTPQTATASMSSPSIARTPLGMDMPSYPKFSVSSTDANSAAANSGQAELVPFEFAVGQDASADQRAYTCARYGCCMHIPKIGNMTPVWETRSADGERRLNCVVGPFWPVMVFITYPLIIVINTIIAIFILPWCHIAVQCIFFVLLAVVVVSLALTACKDPGLLRRQRTKPAGAQGWTYSDQGTTYRPPMAMYCQPAAVVIEGYDHMCPWTGTAIGKGNLNYFWAFAGSLNVLLYYNFAVIVYGLIMRFK